MVLPEPSPAFDCSLLFSPPPRTSDAIFDGIWSEFILCWTASGGMPILSILRYFDAIFSSSSDNVPPSAPLLLLIADDAVPKALDKPVFSAAAVIVGGDRETSTSCPSPLGDKQVNRSFVRSLCENCRYRSNSDSSSSVRLLLARTSLSVDPPPRWPFFVSFSIFFFSAGNAAAASNLGDKAEEFLTTFSSLSRATILAVPPPPNRP
mmetsp:Transcript_41983/g.88163  ORF Transcript_41983/g.88163 Transcript_41983/m.88163 type:complete len:207 (+) Transcript_41983:2901-3521(+)